MSSDRCDSSKRSCRLGTFYIDEHSLAKVPTLLVVGKKEATERTVSIRRLGSDKQQTMPLDAALAALVQEAVPPDVKRMKKAA